MRSELAAIESGFGKLPDLSGNGYKIAYVNAAGTALTLSSSVTFDVSGNLLVPTAASSDNSTKAASTAFVNSASMAAGNLPVGGTTGQYPVKASATNYDMTWATIVPTIKPPMQAGRYYSNPFILTISQATRTANILYATPIYIGNTTTITKIGIEQSTGAAGNARLGIYNNGTDGLPSSLVLDAGTVTTTATAEKEITISQVLDAGWYTLAAVFDAGGASATSRTITGLSPANWGIGSASTTGFPTINSITGTHTYGALPSTFTSPVIGGGAELLIWVKS